MLNAVVVRFPSAWPWCGFVRRLEEGAQMSVELSQSSRRTVWYMWVRTKFTAVALATVVRSRSTVGLIRERYKANERLILALPTPTPTGTG